MLRVFTLIISFLIVGTCVANLEATVLDFEVANGDANISVSLHLPDSENNAVPVVLVVPGSDRGTRDYFLPYVPLINNVGYGVVLYDKQGVGESSGEFIEVSSENSKVTIAERANVINAIIAHLQRLPSVNNNQIGLLTSSQGAWVATAAFKSSRNIAFMMNYNGGVASVGASDYYDEFMDNPESTIAEGNKLVHDFAGFHGYDGVAVIKEMNIPVLWVYGELDRSHPGFYDMEILKTMDKPNYQIELLKNTTHELIDITTNNISSSMLEISMSWLAKLNSD